MMRMIVTVLVCISASCLLTVEAVGISPSAPTLIFEQEQTVYIIGTDYVTLRCVAPSPSNVEKYVFYQDRVPRKDSSENVYNIEPVTKDKRGSYFCVYYTLDGNISQESAIRTLRVIERPPTPEISFMPQQAVYVRGEELSIVCTSSKAIPGEYYHFYMNGRRLTEAGGQPTDKHQIPALQEGNAGVYICQYGIVDSGRSISTLESAPKTLIVVDPLPAPRPSIRPSPAVVGQQAFVQCEAPGASTVNGYRFYKDGREITEPQGSTQDTYVLNRFSAADQGSYFCLYWRNLSGREIRSPESFRVLLESDGNILNSTLTTKEEPLQYPSVIKVYLIFFGGKLLVLLIALLAFGSCVIHQNRKIKAEKEVQ
uniref:Alpha-1B-glycoprotein n=1 Tax=Geotrypetes seraphini TaxID=260995 RepID=A0A6P8PIB5_GEOSA|nr:alpha-1B-glycoprotein [Geotrypetes seraphini]